MPTYEFRCPEGHVFDRFYRTMSGAETEVPCPTCGKMATRQLSGGAGLLFKGSGFYLTDYGKNAHRGGSSSGSATSGDSSKSSDSSGSKSESKPSESKSSDSSSGSSSSDSKSSSSTNTSSSSGSSGNKSDK